MSPVCGSVVFVILYICTVVHLGLTTGVEGAMQTEHQEGTKDMDSADANEDGGKDGGETNTQFGRGSGTWAEKKKKLLCVVGLDLFVIVIAIACACLVFCLVPAVMWVAKRSRVDSYDVLSTQFEFEKRKLIPPTFFCTVFFGIYVINVTHNTHPMLPKMVGHIIFALFALCFIRAMLVNPGNIPNDDVWSYSSDGRADPQKNPMVNEVKKSGDRRHCKWCGIYKPDRAHHCRVCRTCILKMDHHMPWIYNCVGFGNYKYFFLFMFYLTVYQAFNLWSMAGMAIEVTKCDNSVDKPLHSKICILSSVILSTLFGFFFGIFVMFHIKLMLAARTTLEFCEKHLRRPSVDVDTTQDGSSLYNLGTCENLKQVLGPAPLFWWLPCSPPIGNGLYFITAEMRLRNDLEAGK